LKKNNLKEVSVNISADEYAKKKGLFTDKDTINIVGKEQKPTMGSVTEDDAVIEPQDQATIKYLSNVRDPETNEVSKPFTIADKNYQLIRGIDASNEVVNAVMCIDDNMIHTYEDFERDIALPMKERLEMQGANIQSSPDVQESSDDTYEGYKHYLVNKQTNEVRKFKSIEEMISSNKLDEEEYMNVGRFKKHMNERLFGSSKKKVESLNEVTPTGKETDEEMNIKAEKLMAMIAKRIPQNIIKTITTPIAQREVIAAFAELIGVPRNGLNKLIAGLKDLAKQQQQQGPTAQTGQVGQEQPITEKRVITKNQLTESLKPNKVIKTIKVKDIK
jgi:hypothetical protein